MILVLAVSGLPLIMNCTSSEWPSREIWPPPAPCFTRGSWMFVTFCCSERVWMMPPTADTKIGSATLCFRLWMSTTSLAGCLKPARSSMRTARAVSPDEYCD